MVARMPLTILCQTRDGSRGNGVQNVRATHLTFVFSSFITRSSAHGMDSSRLATTAPTKVTAHKTLNGAGATPLLGGPSAQSVVGSLPPVTQEARPCFGRV